jgi:phosphonate transport system permease protein
MTTVSPPHAAVPRPSRTRRAVAWTLGVAIAVAVLVYAWRDTGMNLSLLVSGYHNMVDLIKRAFPPDWGVFHEATTQALVSLSMAILGTAFAIGASLVLAPFAARNVAPHRSVYEVVRTTMAIIRSIPDLVYALIFVVAVGLGPPAGVLAIALHSTGVLSKLFAEAIEDLEPGPIEAMRMSGASRTQTFFHAVLPTVGPMLIGLMLYRVDDNFRSSMVLGFVGAGGIGFMIYNSMETFQYPQMTTELLVMLVVVLLVERISSEARKRLV